VVVLSDAPEREALDFDAAVKSPVPCTAVVARQFAIWPFAPRTLRLLLLVDPDRSGIDQDGLLRAMQHCCIGSESHSQTNAVRAAINAAHYVLRHHNHEVLPQSQVNAAAVVAAVRSNVAYVAMVGDAAAFAWRSGRLTGQRSITRLGRPLGLDQDPPITLWSTPVRPGDRLVLACGPAWNDDTGEQLREVLGTTPRDELEDRLGEALGGARVLVDDGSSHAQRAMAPAVAPLPAPESAPAGSRRRWLAPLAPLALLIVGAFAMLAPPSQPRHVELRGQAEALLAEARSVGDLYQAHTLAARAVDAAQRAATLAPAVHADIVDEAANTLGEIDRIYPVESRVAVHLGPTGLNVVDLAVSQDRLFTLDVGEDAVRRFDAFTGEQWPTPETLVLRKGAAIGNNRVLDTPVAIQFVGGARPEAGALTVVDRSRMVAQLSSDGALSQRPLASSAAWQRIGALGADAEGNLYVLDSGARKLHEYRAAAQRLVDPPSPLFDARPDLDRVAEVVPLGDIYVRLDDGSVRRLARDGQQVDFDLWTPDGRLGRVAAIAADQAGGLFVADTARGRVIQVTADGHFVRQLRDPALAGVRQLQTSPDGRRLYGLVAAGILAFDIPDFI
jgi:hypothetical protein